MKELLEKIKEKAQKQFNDDIISLNKCLAKNPVHECIVKTMIKLGELPDLKKIPIEEMFFGINYGSTWEFCVNPIIQHDYLNIPNSLDTLLCFLHYHILDDGIFHILKVKMSNNELDEWHYFINTVDDCNWTGRINNWRTERRTFGNPFVVKKEYVGWFSSVEEFADFLDKFYDIVSSKDKWEENPTIFDNLIKFSRI